MKPVGIFEKVKAMEAKIARLETTVLAQSARIEALIAVTPERAPDSPYLDAGAKKMARIAIEVADIYGLTLAELKSKTRRQSISHPRQAAMLAMNDNGFDQSTIARFFGMSCHTSIDYGIKAARARAEA